MGAGFQLGSSKGGARGGGETGKKVRPNQRGFGAVCRVCALRLMAGPAGVKVGKRQGGGRVCVRRTLGALIQWHGKTKEATSKD